MTNVYRLSVSSYHFTAYKTVLHSYGLDSNPTSEDEENSDIELMDVSCQPLVRLVFKWKLINVSTSLSLSLSLDFVWRVGYDGNGKSREQYADQFV